MNEKQQRFSNLFGILFLLFLILLPLFVSFKIEFKKSVYAKLIKSSLSYSVLVNNINLNIFLIDEDRKAFSQNKPAFSFNTDDYLIEALFQSEFKFYPVVFLCFEYTKPILTCLIQRVFFGNQLNNLTVSQRSFNPRSPPIFISF